MRRAVHLLGRAFRETGQAMDRLGLAVAEKDLYKDTFARHRSVMNLYDKVRKKYVYVYVLTSIKFTYVIMLYIAPSDCCRCFCGSECLCGRQRAFV
ncbi:hypothetical protein EON63_01945 [archaeon]|nr:MAG: hypothetical protein EON63_01945 [archaeon]